LRISTGALYSYIVGIKGTIRHNKNIVNENYSTWIVETGINQSILQWQSGITYDISNRWAVSLSYRHFMNSLFTDEINYQKLSSINLGAKFYLNK